MTWHSASRWLSASPWTFSASRSAANVSPRAPAGTSWPVFMWCDAGCGLSGPARSSIGAASDTDRPSVTSRQAAATRSGVMKFSAPRRSRAPHSGTARSRSYSSRNCASVSRPARAGLPPPGSVIGAPPSQPGQPPAGAAGGGRRCPPLGSRGRLARAGPAAAPAARPSRTPGTRSGRRRRPRARWPRRLPRRRRCRPARWRARPAAERLRPQPPAEHVVRPGLVAQHERQRHHRHHRHDPQRVRARSCVVHRQVVPRLGALTPSRADTDRQISPGRWPPWSPSSR